MEREMMLADGAGAMREAYHKDLGKLEEKHRQLMGDLQQQHRAEVAALLQERDKLLQEEKAATMAAIVAMRRTHKQELEKSRQSQHRKESADITQLHIEYEKEIRSVQKELEALSAQHTQKCLENSRLSQELQAERQSAVQHTNEQDKVYAENKLKALYHRQDESHHDVSKLEDVKFATWSPSVDASGQTTLEDAVTRTSNAAFLKRTVKSTLTRQIRGVRSKVKSVQ
ncbi:Myosin phosphatase Rho-interacting protein [Liparis tanakae]|uniref:Myosin phosphatase Rho-interacting protein n=1 Tax=Liparis tanakae TaxID=230148 RepID=A0A4Z2IZI8_9TELE|nr:Myosin phosphatase Rho-interacting protein [Liparis tanakae]